MTGYMTASEAVGPIARPVTYSPVCGAGYPAAGRKTSAEITRLFKIHWATVSQMLAQARLECRPRLGVGFGEDSTMTPDWGTAAG
jgi:hypothetical protein